MLSIKAFTKTALIFRKYFVKIGIYFLVYGFFIDSGNIWKNTNGSVIRLFCSSIFFIDSSNFCLFRGTYKITFCPVNIYLFKINNRNIRKKCEICLKLTIKTPERLHWRRSCVFIVNFEHISHLFLVFLVLTLSK